MTHGPAHHIEHAEHSAHAAHDTFDKRVTMSIAIVAAVLAAVTMLGHRSHNETLRLQGEALELQTKASIKSTETANKWAYYQSKNVFNLESEITLDLLMVQPMREGREKEYDALLDKYKSNVKKYSGYSPKVIYARKKGDNKGVKEEKVPGTDGESDDCSLAEDHGKDHGSHPKTTTDKQAPKTDEKKKVEGKLDAAEREAKELDAEAKELLKQSEERMTRSHHEHEKAARLDYGELGLQFGVVLCSLAILTKGRGFWFSGLASSILGALIALTGQFSLFMGGHH